MDLKPAVILYLFFQFWILLCRGQEEGSSCILKDGNEGVCLNLSDCDYAYNDFKSLTLPKFCSLSLWQPLVCCPDCSFIQKRLFGGVVVNFAFKMLLEVQFTGSNPELTEYKRKHMGCLEAFLSQHFPCNIYERFKNLDDSIHCYDISLEGHDEFSDNRHQDMRIRHPHLALIGYGDDNPDYARWLCSGSIISDKYILTAAHCHFNPELGEIKFAALGTEQWPNDLRYWQIYKVVKIIIHPEYAPPSKYHDIALLETAAKIIYNLEVIPACLQRFDYMPKEATATGWNAIGQLKHPADILNGVPIIQFSHVACTEAFAKHRQLTNGYNSSIQACYGDADYINDVCMGDSGGPLQVFTNQTRKAKCLHTILGIASYGRACGLLGTAGLYTRIAAYVPWIESITGYLT